MSKKARATKFPGDFNSHGDIMTDRIHRGMGSTKLKNDYWKRILWHDVTGLGADLEKMA